MSRWYVFPLFEEESHIARRRAGRDAGSTGPDPGACGAEKQDENEPEGDFKVDVVSASFPGRQHLADEANLRLEIRNSDSSEIPNLAVTVDGFGQRRDDPTLADPERPIWIVNDAPRNSTPRSPTRGPSAAWTPGRRAPWTGR